MVQEYAEGIVIAVNPVIFRLGPVVLRWYAVFIALGLTVGLYVVLLEARRKGLDEDAVYSCVLWSVVGGILGGRVLHVLDKLDFYLQNQWNLFSLGQGGLAMWGSLLAGLLVASVCARRRRLSTMRLADAAVPGLLVGQIIGRIGSVVNGESWGAPTTSEWGFVYVHPDAMLPVANLGIPTHPYPVYEMAWHLLVLGVLWRLRERLEPDGAVLAVYLLSFSVGKLALTFVRQEGIFVFGLQQAQVLAIVVFLFALPFLVYLFTVRPGSQGRAGDGQSAPSG